MQQPTNATKALAISFINANLALFLSLLDSGLSEPQKGALLAAVNAALGLFVALTYKRSPKRIPGS